jgi:hypothetical protein
MDTSERKGERSQLGVCRTEDYGAQDDTLSDGLGKPQSEYIPQKPGLRMQDGKQKKDKRHGNFISYN